MSPVPSKVAKEIDKSRKREAKREAKREELARAAIATLAHLGFARTSLRDIAEQTGSSVGLIHYYFEDKLDLIEHCVRLFKRDFVARVDALIAQDLAPDAMTDLIIEALVATVRHEAPFHRMWDDIVAQAMFEPRFQGAVHDIEASLIGMFERLFAKIGADPEHATEAYMAVHGVFHIHLLHFLSGDPSALDDLQRRMRSTLGRFRT